MVTGELKSKIDSLWEIFWTGGLTNPLDVIEQMTYLMFIHDLDESDNTHAKEAAMLGLPYKSIFAGEVQVGERTVDCGRCTAQVERFPRFPGRQNVLHHAGDSVPLHQESARRQGQCLRQVHG